MAHWFLPALALLALALTGCAEDQPSGPPDVFLISVDTLRADHLPVYGYERDTAPWLTGVAERGVVFEAASSTTSWTVPAVGSKLSGLLPHQAGLSAAPSFTDRPGQHPALPRGALTLAEHLAEHGYATWGVTANGHLIRERGFGQGFEHYANVGFSNHQKVREALDAWAADIRASEQPVFVWVHLFDPHEPYQRNAPWLARWAPGYADYAPTDAAGEPLRELHRTYMKGLKARPDLQPGGVGLSHLRALYDSEIRDSDQALAGIAADLGIDEHDVVVFVADHGEEFRDHGELGHRNNLFEETVRVPLIVAAPGLEPRRVRERVSIASVPATAADLAGAPPFPQGYGSLGPLARGEAGAAEEPVVATVFARGGLHLQALYDGHHKLITSNQGPTTLYDLEADPGEGADVAASHPERVAALEERLTTWLQGLETLPRAYIELHPEPGLRAKLEAMGYLEPEDEEGG